MTTSASAIIGTAGHIDHGKTALVRALTGQDTDRLRAEKERGISIELGFAHLDVPGVGRVGVVDVPGHERFIRTMLAGVHGIDLVLLTVSADDGVMPQTEEHVDILHLLDVRRGIVVVTKSDLVDAARIDAVREEVEILTLDTTLEGTPVIPVSATMGTGLDELRAEIGRQLRGYRRVPRSGYFRLPVDRAFLMKGHGLVVTGTAIAGEITVGAGVRVLPGADTARVRGIEVHGIAHERAGFGQRVALNLSGIERPDVGRGHVVCDERLRRDTTCFDAAIELRPGPRRRLRTHGSARLHLGTSEILATVVLLDGRETLAPGERTYCQLRLREPVVALRGDRFVLRTETARATVGGGVVIHAFARHHRRREEGLIERLRALGDGPPAAALRALLELSPVHSVSLDDATQGLGLRQEEVLTLARDAPGVLAVPDGEMPDAFVLATRATRLETAVLETVGRHHERHELAPGMELESVRTQLTGALDVRVYRWLVDRLVSGGALVRDGSIVRLPTHRVALDARGRQVGDRVERMLREAGLTPPDPRTLTGAGCSARELEAVLTVLEREGRVVRVAPDLYYARDAVERGISLLREYCGAHREITAAAFRDLIGASRKFSIAFLDYCDRTGITLRVGDVRRLR